jgi:hypothetical protein
MGDAAGALPGAAAQARRAALVQALRSTVPMFGVGPEGPAETQELMATMMTEMRRVRAHMEATEPGSFERMERKRYDARLQPDSLEHQMFGSFIARAGGFVDYSIAWGFEVHGLSLVTGGKEREGCDTPLRGRGAGRWGSVPHDTYAVAPRCDACGAPGSPAAPLRRCGACVSTFAAYYCNDACAKRGWREGGHKRACAAVRALLARQPLYVQRAAASGDDSVAALLAARPSLPARLLAVLHRFADVRCRNETLYFKVQDGELSPEAVVAKLAGGTFMPVPSASCCPAADPGDELSEDEAEAYFARPNAAQGLSRHEAWLLFAALGESGGGARAADVALDALYCYAAAMWEARWALRTEEATPEQRAKLAASTVRVPFDASCRSGV